MQRIAGKLPLGEIIFYLLRGDRVCVGRTAALMISVNLGGRTPEAAHRSQPFRIGKIIESDWCDRSKCNIHVTILLCVENVKKNSFFTVHFFSQELSSHHSLLAFVELLTMNFLQVCRLNCERQLIDVLQ
ncbi:hypothetical protein ES705_42843 [subsurface metagenome]